MAISVARLLVDVTVDAKDAAETLDKFGRKLSKDFPGQAAAGKIALAQFAGVAGGYAVTAVSALTSGLVAFTGAAAPASGVALGLAPIFAAVGQGAGVATLAFQGVSDAATKIGDAAGDPKKLAKAIAGLTPEAAKMAQTLADTKGPLDDLRSAAQRGLFPGVNDALSSALDLLPKVQDEVTLTGKAMGDLAVKGSTLLASRQNALQTIMRNNVPIITSLGNAGLSLANALITVTRVAGPLGGKLANLAESFAAYIDDTVAAGASSGRLAAFLKRSYDVAAQLGNILVNLGETAFHVFSAGAATGQKYLDVLEQGSQRMLEWSESAKGLESMNAWYAKGLKNNEAMARLVKAVGTEFAKTSKASGGFTTTIDKITTTLVPALGNLMRALSDPAAVNSLIDSLATLAGILARTGGTLDTFAAVFGGVIHAMDWLTQNVPGATQALALFLTMAAGRKALGIVGLGGAVDTLTGKIVKLTLAAARSATVDFAAGFKSTAAAASPLTGIFGTLGGAVAKFGASMKAASLSVLTFPGTWIILGLVAVGVALVELYKHSETFRNIVNGVWASIQSAWAATLGWITGTAVPWIVNAFQSMVSGVTTAVNAVVAVVQSIVGFVSSVVSAIAPTVMRLVEIFSQPFQGIIRIVKGAFDVIAGIFTGDWNRVLNGIATGIAGILQLFLGFPVQVARALVQFAPTLMRLGTEGVTALGRAIAAAAPVVWEFFSSLPGKAWNLAASLGSLLGKLATNAMAAMGRGLVSAAGAVWSFFRALPGKVGGFLAALPGQLLTLATTAMNRLHDGEVAGGKAVLTYMSQLPGKIVSGLGDLGSLLLSAGADVVRGLANGIANASHFITDAAGKLKDKTIAAVKGAFGIHSPATTMLEPGGFITEGLALGMGSTTALAKLKGAAAAAVSAAKPAVPTWASTLPAAITTTFADEIKRRSSAIDYSVSSLTAHIGKQLQAIPKQFQDTAAYAVTRLQDALTGGELPTGPGASAAQKLIETMYGDYDEASKRRADLIEKITAQGVKVTNADAALSKNARQMRDAESDLKGAKTSKEASAAKDRIATLKDQAKRLNATKGSAEELTKSLRGEVSSIEKSALYSGKVRDQVADMLITGGAVLDSIAAERETLATRIKDATAALQDAVKARADFAAGVQSTVASFASLGNIKGGEVDADKVTALTGKVELAQDRLTNAQDAAQAASDDATKAQDALTAAQAKYGSGSTEAGKAADNLAAAQRRAATAATASKAANLDLTSSQKALEQANKGEALSADLVVKKRREQLASTQAFAANIKALRAAGLNDTDLKDLIAQGPQAGGDLAAAIASGGASAIASINDTQAQIQSIAGDLGTSSAGWFYDAGVNAAQGILDGLNAKDAELKAAMDTIAQSLTDAVKRALGIHSPSRVMRDLFQYVPEGAALGIQDGLGTVGKAALAMATAATVDPMATATAPRSRFQPGTPPDAPGASTWAAGGDGAAQPVVGVLNVTQADMTAAQLVDRLAWLQTTLAGRS